MRLTSHDKLALTFQTATNFSKLALLLGVSRSTATRWLKSGNVPAHGVANVDNAFKIHKDITKQIAKQHGLPYSNALPVFIHRMRKRDGMLGDHIQAPNLQYLRDAVKFEYLRQAGQTGAFHSAYFQSIVDLDIYTGNYVNREFAEKSAATKRKLIKKMKTAYLSGFIGANPNVNYNAPMHTKREAIDATSGYVDLDQAINSMKVKLDRLNTSAVIPSNKLFLQVYPSNYAKPNAKQTRKSTAPKTRRNR